MKKQITPIKLAILLLLTGLSVSLNAQNVNIPDVAFKTILLANSSINTNADGEIDVSEALAYNGPIIATTAGISDLTGIQAFLNITALDVSQNSLGSIDLYYNTDLTSLNVSLNGLSCLDISRNTALVSVDCSDNLLTSLNLKNGNNVILTNMNAINAGFGLNWIQVDNVAAANAAPGWFKDPTPSYCLTNGPPVTAINGSNAPVCCGSPVNFNDASINAFTFHWDFGDGNTSVVQNPTHIYGAPGDFNVSLVAANCYNSDTAIIIIPQGMDINGNVSYSLGNVTSGVAILFPSLPFFAAYDTFDIRPINALGDYQFMNVPQGNYLVKIIPDTIAFPTLVPTYWYNDWAWDSSVVHLQDCIVDGTANVLMVELTPMIPNIGFAQGFVLEGPGFGRAQGDPIYGVDIKLGITGTSNIVATTETDTTGQFTFSNIGFGTYTIYVDIAGLYRDSLYTFTIDGTNSSFLNLYHLVDSVKIYIVPGIGIEDIESSSINKMDVFPNPSKGNVTINYGLNSNANVQLDVYNLAGIKVQSLVNAHQLSGEYAYQFNPKNTELKPGIYFISLSANGKAKTKRVILIE